LGFKPTQGAFYEKHFHDDAQALALIAANGVQADTWVSMATYSDPKASRSQDNAEKLCSLWLDVDAHEGCKYKSVSEVEAAIDMIEFDRADSLYIVTTPDVDASDNMLSTEDIIGFTEVYDTTYAATYWPWVKIGDSQNDSNIFLPPTISVLTNIAKNDNTSGIQPWDATAGVTRGDIAILDLRINEDFKYLSKVDVDYLYNNRINPLIKIQLYQNPITYSGFKIWGNKTLSNTNYLTNRVNVRRLLLEMRTIINSDYENIRQCVLEKRVSQKGQKYLHIHTHGAGHGSGNRAFGFTSSFITRVVALQLAELHQKKLEDILNESGKSISIKHEYL
jgi:hypothetical protein